MIDLHYINLDIQNWPIYDVLVIRWRDNIAYKISVRIIWTKTFHYAKSKRKKIVLG